MGAFQQLQGSMQDAQVSIGGDHVDMVWLNLQAILYLAHRHLGPFPHQFRQQADVGGVQVGNQHKGQPAVRGHGFEKGLESLQATGGGTDTDYGKLSLTGLLR